MPETKSTGCYCGVGCGVVIETAAQEWLKNMMTQGASTDAVRSWILAPVAALPRGSLNRGVTVCTSAEPLAGH